MRLAVDLGGTFTDLVLETDAGLTIHKAPTTPDDPVAGILSGVSALAAVVGLSSGEDLLRRVSTVIHGTTRATNAILTGSTAKTAFVATEGHPDILLFKVGGREDPFRHDRDFPAPYVPRALTFEVDERIDYRGRVVRPIDMRSVDQAVERLIASGAEAVGVCLLWSVANGMHERVVGEAILAAAPHLHVTLSHELNPVVREYYRASAACIDASVKPVMSTYLADLRRRLEDAGFVGRLLVASASGGLLEPEWLASAPIHSINSGPALAPVAGAHHAALEAGVADAVVVDAGGTSFDVSVVRNGRIPRTRETWLGHRFEGHLTGFPSIDVRTTGSGGGSIARVDSGGLISVGPESAGSSPGPACYGRGGSLATVTDAAVILGYLDPERLKALGIEVDRDAAMRAIDEHIGDPLRLSTEDAAEVVIRVVTEQMVHAVEEVTVDQGLDPRNAVLVAGGGAAGFNVVTIAARLGCHQVIVPGTCAALSATGGLMSDIASEHARAAVVRTHEFDYELVNEVLSDLVTRSRAWITSADLDEQETTVELLAEARYPGQVWELELPLRLTEFRDADDVDSFCEDFHTLHDEMFAVRDTNSPVEVIGWRARVSSPSGETRSLRLAPGLEPSTRSRRSVYFGERGWDDIPVVWSGAIREVSGPAILELPATSVLLQPATVATRSEHGAIVISVSRYDPRRAGSEEMSIVR